MAEFDTFSLRKGLRRALYYAANKVAYAIPTPVYRAWWRMRFALIPARLKNDAAIRLDYYCRLDAVGEAPVGTRESRNKHKLAVATVGSFKYPKGKKKKLTTYFYDLYQTIRLVALPQGRKFAYVFGDVDAEASEPAFTKTRPVAAGASNNVLLPLNKVRHYQFVRDRRKWRDKKDMLVFRNDINGKPHRLRFIEAIEGNPMCDCGEVSKQPVRPDLAKPYMSVHEQLGYKFIATLEGNDVATNLKWVMSSQSIAVMPRPRFESWYMEATLIPGVHYIEIADDFSDLDEKLRYYLDHPDEAEAIVRNANNYAKRFRNKALERWLARETAIRYFNSARIS